MSAMHVPGSREGVVVGVDPHKASWTAVAVTADLTEVGALRVHANRAGYRELWRFAARWSKVRWAIEGETELCGPSGCSAGPGSHFRGPGETRACVSLHPGRFWPGAAFRRQSDHVDTFRVGGVRRRESKGEGQCTGVQKPIWSIEQTACGEDTTPRGRGHVVLRSQLSRAMGYCRRSPTTWIGSAAPATRTVSRSARSRLCC